MSGFGNLEITERALNHPSRCLFTGDTEGPYLNLNRELDLLGQTHAYIHVPFVKELGRAVGMVDPEDIDAIASERDELAEENAELLAKLAVLEAKEALVG